jgi:hypothetical protein
MPLFKTCTFILIFIASSFCTMAQQFKERVYLKDSVTFYEGYIIEQAPAKYVKIYRLIEKDTLTVLLTDVLKLTKVYVIDSILKKEEKVKEKIKKPRYTKVAFLELLGAGGLYSVNYDMRTAKGRRDGWGFRVGYERILTTYTDSTPTSFAQNRILFTAVPIVLNYLYGKKKGFLELGVGATYFNFIGEQTGLASVESYKVETFKDSFGSIIGTFNIGYRHVPYKSGFMYRVAFTPLLLDNIVLPFIGIGLGYHFK